MAQHALQQWHQLGLKLPSWSTQIQAQGHTSRASELDEQVAVALAAAGFEPNEAKEGGKGVNDVPIKESTETVATSAEDTNCCNDDDDVEAECQDNANLICSNSVNDPTGTSSGDEQSDTSTSTGTDTTVTNTGAKSSDDTVIDAPDGYPTDAIAGDEMTTGNFGLVTPRSVSPPVPVFTYEASLDTTLAGSPGTDGVGQMMGCFETLTAKYNDDAADHVPISCDAALRLATRNKARLHATSVGYHTQLFEDTEISTTPIELLQDVAAPHPTDNVDNHIRTLSSLAELYMTSAASQSENTSSTQEMYASLLGASLRTLSGIQRYGEHAAQLQLPAGAQSMDAIVGEEMCAILGVIDEYCDNDAPALRPLPEMVAAKSEYDAMKKFEATKKIGEARDLAMAVDKNHKSVIHELGERIAVVQGRVDEAESSARHIEEELGLADLRFWSYMHCLEAAANKFDDDARKVSEEIDKIHRQHQQSRVALELYTADCEKKDALALQRIHNLKLGPYYTAVQLTVCLCLCL